MIQGAFKFALLYSCGNQTSQVGISVTLSPIHFHFASALRVPVDKYLRDGSPTIFPGADLEVVIRNRQDPFYVCVLLADFHGTVRGAAFCRMRAVSFCSGCSGASSRSF